MASSSKAERALLHSLDYPCTARLRRRRLLAYLRGQSYNEIYQAAKEKMGVIFHVWDLVKLVKAGQLQEAALYVRSFAPPKQSSNEAVLLVVFLEHLRAINCFAHGQTTAASILCDWFISIHRHPVLAKYPCFAALVDDVLFLHPDRVRNFLDWQLVRNKAVKMVEEMACNTPELRDRMHYPRGRNNLYHVVSTGYRYSFRRSCHMKRVGRKQSIDLAQFYLQTMKRLPSSGQGPSHSLSGSEMSKGERQIALLERALEAGRRRDARRVDRKPANRSFFCGFCRRPVLKQGLPQVFPLKALLTRGSMVNYAPSRRASD